MKDWYYSSKQERKYLFVEKIGTKRIKKYRLCTYCHIKRMMKNEKKNIYMYERDQELNNDKQK